MESWEIPGWKRTKSCRGYGMHYLWKTLFFYKVNDSGPSRLISSATICKNVSTRTRKRQIWFVNWLLTTPNNSTQWEWTDGGKFSTHLIICHNLERLHSWQKENCYHQQINLKKSKYNYYVPCIVLRHFIHIISLDSLKFKSGILLFTILQIKAKKTQPEGNKALLRQFFQLQSSSSFHGCLSMCEIKDGHRHHATLLIKRLSLIV